MKTRRSDEGVADSYFKELQRSLNGKDSFSEIEPLLQRVLLIDNYDSFTYNLAQLIESLGADLLVKTHDQISLQEAIALNPEALIISPGPKDPKDSGISIPMIEHFYKQIPVLGVCLGHQCLGYMFGAKIVQAKKIMHGKTSLIQHDDSGIFKGISNPMKVARYHSLAISKVPEDFILSAWTEDDNEIMGIAHKNLPVFGVQFHPESFLTEEGETLMRNFLAYV